MHARDAGAARLLLAPARRVVATVRGVAAMLAVLPMACLRSGAMQRDARKWGTDR